MYLRGRWDGMEFTETTATWILFQRTPVQVQVTWQPSNSNNCTLPFNNNYEILIYINYHGKIRILIDRGTRDISGCGYPLEPSPIDVWRIRCSLVRHRTFQGRRLPAYHFINRSRLLWNIYQTMTTTIRNEETTNTFGDFVVSKGHLNWNWVQFRMN